MMNHIGGRIDGGHDSFTIDDEFNGRFDLGEESKRNFVNTFILYLDMITIQFP